MIPLRIALKGFMCYRDRQEVDFAGVSLWVLAGANGSGKSTIFDAVTVALYGMHRAGSQHLDELINHHADGLEIDFDFQLGSGVYRVRRTLQRRGTTTYGAFTLGPDGRVRAIPDTNSATGFKRWVEETIGLSQQAFTSCVLLRQGDADALLNAKPRERFGILSSLIDLARYEKLHDLVDEQRKQLAAETKIVRQQLAGMAYPDDPDTDAAEQAFLAAYQEMQVAQAEVQQLTVLAEQSRQWERIVADLAEITRKCTATEGLLTRACEITAADARWRELDRNLPQLRAVTAARERLAQLAPKLEELIRQTEALAGEMKDAEHKAREAGVAYSASVERVEATREALGAVQDCLTEAKRLVQRLEEFEECERVADEIEQEIAGCPSNLSARIESAERGVQQLGQTRQALPWLRRIIEQRERLITGLTDAAEARGHLCGIDAELASCLTEIEYLRSAAKAAEVAERAANNAAQQAEAHQQAARNELSQFDEVAEEAFCSRCGQMITPEHAEQEVARLRQELNDAAAVLERARAEHNRTEIAVIESRQQLVDGQERCTHLQETSRSHKAVVERTEHKIEHALCDLGQAWSNLPPALQSRVAASTPPSADAWPTTTWPSTAEVAQLDKQVAELDAVGLELDEMRKQERALAKLAGQREEVERRVAAISLDLDRAAAEQARMRLPELEASRQTLEATLQEALGCKANAKERADTFADRLAGLSESCRRAETDYATAEATRREVEGQIASALGQLSDNWRDAAACATLDALSVWESEYDELADYPRQAQELGGAQARLDELRDQERRVREQAASIPTEAQRPTDLIAHLCEQAVETFTRVNTRQAELQSELDRMMRERDEYQRVQAGLLLVERRTHLHTRLVHLLGRTGLQMALLRRAELAIIHEANEILDRLSGGRMRLELRNADGQGESALDLLYHDGTTATQPIPIALASGSQRFRIAVSLALAIGRYLGHESERVRSVIIDEGFGSLDKSGRGDMITVLTELQMELDRIILVSHQEEIAEAFPNCYAVQLVEGASRVSLAPAD